MKKLFALSLLLILPWSLAPSVEGASKKSEKLARLRQAVQAKLNELHAGADWPGATVGFVLADGSAASVSTGLADVENRVALKPTDRMLAGSIGKTYVAAVTLQLVQEGKLNLDDKIERWFAREPWFNRLPNAKTITLRMLMNHTSGIPEHVLNERLVVNLKKDPDKVWSPEELVAYILRQSAAFSCGRGLVLRRH